MNHSSLPQALAENDGPRGKTKRAAQLRLIIEELAKARFPTDYNRFEPFTKALREESDEGKTVQSRWLVHVSQKLPVPGVSNPPLICPPTVFLPLLQAELTEGSVRRWRDLTVGLPSPKRAQASDEPVPATRARLMEEARREEEVVIQKLRGEFDVLNSIMAYGQLLKNSNQTKPKQREPKARRKSAQRRQDRTPGIPNIVTWSQPMSLTDYVKATGRNRKTIERWLRNLQASPAIRGRHAADSDRYDAATNLKILALWIGGPRLTAKHAGGLAAAIIALACINDVKFVPDLLAAIVPVIKSRGLGEEARKMFPEHVRLYSPPPALFPDPFASVLGVPGSALNT